MNSYTKTMRKLLVDRASFVANSAIEGLKLLQQEMTGEAEKVGLKNEEDIQKLLEENRQNM